MDSTPESQTTTAAVDQTLQETPKRKSIFVDDTEEVTVYLDEAKENWVKLPEKFSYQFTEQFAESMQADDKTRTELFVARAIRTWNLVDEQGMIAEITPNNVRRLEMKTLMLIVNEIDKRIGMNSIPKGESPR